MSDMAGKAAQVAVERSGRLPRYKADQLSTLNYQRFAWPNRLLIGKNPEQVFG
jgi:hypothetical protein